MSHEFTSGFQKVIREVIMNENCHISMDPILKGFGAMNIGIMSFVSRRPHLHRDILFVDCAYFTHNEVNNTRKPQLWAHENLC
jgi:hypothetical protein